MVKQFGEKLRKKKINKIRNNFMSEKLPNQASFQFDENKNSGDADVIINQEEIGMLHAQFDNPNTEFDIAIEDQSGNVQYEKKGCKNPSGRWGERIDLPVVDDYYKIRLSNVKGAKSINLFLE